MSDFYGHRDDEESIATLQRAVGLGVTFFDTADMYGSFTNEQLVGNVLKPYREKIILATKFGIARSDDPNHWPSAVQSARARLPFRPDSFRSRLP
nr:aldo/keto reductase [uncultured Desulfuromonas sp.]